MKTNAVRFEPLGRSFRADASRADLPDQVPELLSACRDRLVQGVAEAFRGRMDQAAEELLALGERAASAPSRNPFFAAHAFLTDRGPALLKGFCVEFVAAHDATMADLERPLILPVTEDSSELCLVEDDDFERELVIGKLSTRAGQQCSQQLAALEQRVAALLEGRLLIRMDNSLAPKALFAAFLTACRAHGAHDQVDLALLQEFARQVTDALPAIYHELNGYLSGHGVLPNLPLGATPPMDAGMATAGARTTAAVVHGHAATPTMAERPEDRAVASDTPGVADVFGKVAERLEEAQALSLRPPPIPSKAAAGAAHAAAQLVAALTRLQKGSADAEHLPGIDPSQIDSAARHLLQRLRGTALVVSARAANTVDLVVMLFDLILDEHRLAEPLRAQVDRLRIPILKAAILDRAFFSNRQHPVRRFLDAFARAAAEWEQHDLPRLIGTLTRIVDAIVADFDEEIGIFSTELAVLEAFLADEARRPAGERPVDVSHDGTGHGTTQGVAEQIQRHTSNEQLPEAVRDFLERCWREVLIAASRAPGKSTRDWDDALTTMDDLIWSVTPKTDEQDRRRLLDMLPGLLHRLRSGLTSVGLEQAWDGFFARIVRLHVEAIHPDPGAAARPPKTPAQGQDQPAPAASPPTQTAAPIPEPASRGEDAYLQLARGLQIGCWIEFRSPRGNKRTMRLTWCSEQRGAYLFSSRQGDDTLMVATTSLAEQLRDGSAQIVSRERVPERPDPGAGSNPKPNRAA